MSKKAEEKNLPAFSLIDSPFPSLCPRTSPMTTEELEILAEMRKLKAQARAVKSQLARILPGWKQYVHSQTAIPGEAKTCLDLLDDIRMKWKKLEQAYKEARHRRMVALGHEDI
jgi:hypothetical protein